jgi:hypothetical protein
VLLKYVNQISNIAISLQLFTRVYYSFQVIIESAFSDRDLTEILCTDTAYYYVLGILLLLNIIDGLRSMKG